MCEGMVDREKVIKGLECCLSTDSNDCTPMRCPYFRICGGEGAPNAMLRDAIALLKAQEPVEPTNPDDDMEIYCGYCGEIVGFDALGPSGLNVTRFNYCANCGRAVKWE